MKRPAFQFYPADWRTDMALQSCSVAARGLWMDMLCIAHECEPYGHLTVNGKAMTSAQIGRHTGLTERDAKRLIAELDEAGVASRTPEGVIYSRRMVRDEELRNRRAEGGKAGSEHGYKGAEHGAKGGRPTKGRGVSEPPLKPPLKPPPSSSSSSSTAVESASALSARARVGVALIDAGIDKASVNTADPRLMALLDQGATAEEFAGVAREAVAKGKGVAWVLVTLAARRTEAATLAARPSRHAGFQAKNYREGVSSDGSFA